VRHGTTDLFAALNRQTDCGLAVHVICDNLSAHKAPTVQRWLLAHPQFVLHFTPIYASWINQVERWFAELQRRCLERGVFCSLDELTTALQDWIKLWNEGARPFTWTRTPTRSSTASAATAHASPDRLTRPLQSLPRPPHCAPTNAATQSRSSLSPTSSTKPRARSTPFRKCTSAFPKVCGQMEVTRLG
jgi:transposase